MAERKAKPKSSEGTRAPLEEALGWIGFRVDDMNGSRVARVEAIYVDSKDDEPLWVVVKLGRFGKMTAIPYTDCADGPGRVWAAHGRKAVRSAPPVEAGKPMTRELEMELYEHYLIGPGRGRHKELQDRDQAEATAKPAR